MKTQMVSVVEILKTKMAPPPQVMAISLALTVSTAELEQLQQTPGVLVALA